MRSSDLADQLRVSRGAVSNLTDRLHKEGFVRRVRSREDRRVVQIELTPEGAHFLDEKERERITWLSSLFGQLDTKDLDDLLRIFRKVVDLMDSDAFDCEPDGKHS